MEGEGGGGFNQDLVNRQEKIKLHSLDVFITLISLPWVGGRPCNHHFLKSFL